MFLDIMYMFYINKQQRIWANKQLFWYIIYRFVCFKSFDVNHWEKILYLIFFNFYYVSFDLCIYFIDYFVNM